MRSMLALCAFVAGAVSANAGGVVRRNHLLRHQEKEPASAKVDAAVKDKTPVAKFGPGNCVSTWRNEDGHCEVETQCKDQDISKYAVKFICIDAGGEKVRHVFAGGSFDSEEQFDTLIECNKCLAEKQETIEIIADAPKGKAAKLEEDSDQLGGSPLVALRAEVKELEGFMMSTSAELQKLNAKVYSKDFEGAKVHSLPAAGPAGAPPAAGPAAAGVGKAAAAKALKASAASLVHHKKKRHEMEVQAAKVRKAHRRHIEEEDGGDVAPIEKAKVVAKKAVATSSMASAVKTAEERDDAVPAQQPGKSVMMAEAATAKAESHFVKKPKPVVVALPKNTEADGEDDADGEDVQEDISADVVPQSADAFEKAESDTDDTEVPSLAMLQKDDDDTADGAEDDDEDASE